MVVVASSPGSVGGGVGIALGAAQDEANKQKKLAIEQERQANDTAETRMRIALQQEELKTKLGYKDAANQAADIFGNLQPSQAQGPQQGPPDPSTYGPPEASGPLPADFAPMPGGIADGTVGSAHPDRQKAEWGGLEQYHAALMQKAMQVGNGMDPEMRREMFGALKEKMQLHAQQLHANQLSASIHDAVVGGALDPTDPSTGQRTPDEEVRKRGLEFSDRVQKGDLTAAEAYQKIADRALESHTAISHRIAFGASALQQLSEKAAKDPNSVSDRARMLADGVKSGMIPIEYYNAEMPAALASTKTNTVPGPEALRQITAMATQERAQAATETAQARMENAQSRLEIAKMKSENDKTNAEFSNKLKEAQTNLESAKTSYQNTLNDLAGKGQKPTGIRGPGSNERADAIKALSTGNAAFHDKSEADQNAAIKQYLRIKHGEEPPPPDPVKPGIFSQLFSGMSTPPGEAAPRPEYQGGGPPKPPSSDAPKGDPVARGKQLASEGKSEDEIRKALAKEFGLK